MARPMAGGGEGIIDSKKVVGGWPELRSERAPADSDHEGMSDAWERQHVLDPNNPAEAQCVPIREAIRSWKSI